MKLIAACAFGLEKPLKWELEALGYQPRVDNPGRVAFEGEWIDVAKTNLWLRVADRVLIELQQFSADNFDALFETVKAFNWSDWLPADSQFPVNGRSRLSQLTSVPAVQRSVKKAIVQSMQAGHNTQELPETGAEFRIEVALLNDIATITLDTTGASLHKRGYRTLFGEAPIKETLAAAMVMLSVWNKDRPLIDPFCGSGTILIEAAMIARNLAPGAKRTFLWDHWPQTHSIDRRQLLHEQSTDTIELQISGYDTNERVLKAARRNAFAAGVDSDIHFQLKSFEELRSKREFGCIITNPPYGERLNERRELLPLYNSFPAVFQRLPTWSHFIITNMPKFEGLLRKSATRRRKLYNGRIECMYYQFLGPRPDTRQADEKTGHSPTPKGNSEQEPANTQTAKSTQPVFGGLEDKDHHQAELFATRLQKRARHFRRWPTKQGITCFRLYERDIPELPFVVDRYDNCYHITEYERPHDRDPGRHASWLELMKKTVAKTFDTPINRVFLKTRLRQTGLKQHGKVDQSRDQMVVEESGLKFLVNLKDYVDTGLFLDHRQTRQMIHGEADKKHFLNLFAYTGSFSVYAADGGAASTTTVDWSNTYLDWAEENMKLNGFEGQQHQFIRRSAMDFLRELKGSKNFDLAVVDPPTFSNSKRTEDIWDVQKCHLELLQILAEQMKTGGVVYFSTNFRKFQLDHETEKHYAVKDISKQTVPEDFRNKRIHQCWRMVRK